MKTFELKGTLRENLGKKASKKLRAEGLVPCVIYGGEKNVNFYVAENDFKKLIYTGEVYLVSIEVLGNKYNAIVKDLQFDPVTDKITHMDFIEYNENKPFVMSVPVVLEGFAEGVKKGGKLILVNRKLRVKGLAKDMPEVLTVDVTNVDLGKSIKVCDLKFDNLTMVDPGSNLVAAVKLTRAARGAMEKGGK